MSYINPRKNPPPFHSMKSYEQWRKELQAWCRLTKEEEKDWAPLIALGCLAPEDPSGIRDKVFALNLDPDPAVEAVPAVAAADDPQGIARQAVPAIPANDKAGFDRLMAFMDQEFQKDSLTDMCEHIRVFMKMTKKKETTMKSYISDYEAAYKKAKEKGLPVMPPKFLMWSLLESVNISDHEYMLVISGIPADSNDMYEDAKKSLLRFFNSARNTGASCQEDGIALDPDDTHYGRGPQGQRRGGGYPRGRGGGGGRGRKSSPWRNPNTKGGQAQATKNSKPMNPTDSDGNPYRCNSCGSYRHFSKDCQHSHEATNFNQGDDVYDPENDDALVNPSTTEEAVATHYVGVQLYDVLFTSLEGVKDIYFTKATISKLLLDTGCVRTVAGIEWFKHFLKTLSKKTISRIRKYPSAASFRFGGNDIRYSLGFYAIPCSISGKNIILQMDVITSKVPCLVSKTAIKKAGGVIDLPNDSINLFGMSIKMESAKSGHYLLPVEDVVEGDVDETKVFMVNHERPEYNEMQVHKMHKALGHPGRAAFESTIKAANVKIDNLDFILNKLYESCLICLKHHKAHVKPKVGLPLATDFNQTICLDLKIWPKKNAIIFYIIDAYTRFSQAHLIPDKKAETILQALLDGWILNLYGAPNNVLVDNGGEFYNSKFKDMCNNLNIRMYASAAESPFQNGLCERNHSITDKIMEKMMEEDKSLTTSRALSAATFAKNCLVNVNGFSPIQLVTGKMPRLPSVMTNSIPAQEATSTVKAYTDRINGIIAARKAFMEVENSARLNRALKTKVIPPHVVYKTGDQVFYKKEGSEARWEGPAKVIGMDGKTIFIAHGRFTYSTSQSRLVKIPKDEVKEVVTRGLGGTISPQVPPLIDDSDSEDDEEPRLENRIPRDPAPAPPNPAPAPAQAEVIENHAAPVLPHVAPRVPDNERPAEQGAEQEVEEDLNPDNEENQPEEAQEGERKEEEEGRMTGTKRKVNMKKKGLKKTYPKVGQEIFFRVKNWIKYGKVHPTLIAKYGSTWANVVITMKVYAQSQGLGPYFNFKEVGTDFEGGVHLDETEWSFSSSKPLPRTLNDSIHNYLVEDDPEDVYTIHVDRNKWHLPEVQEAMRKELDNFSNFDVYELVKDEGQHFITSGWVIIEKEKEGKWIIKARLVIHGNQERQSVRSDSPTIKKQNLRIQFAIAVQNNWTMCSADVQAAFLQAVNLDREIYVKPPAEANNQGLLWKLKKPMYGLEDSGRQWYITLVQFLEERGCQVLPTDLACIFWHKDGILHGMITIHVDDIQYCGSPDFHQHVIEPMLNKFKFGMIQKGEFKCLGWSLKQHKDHLTIDQLAYVDNKIAPVDINVAGRQSEEQLTAEEISKMRGIIGKFRWLADQTRPDQAYDELELSMNANKAQVKDVKLSTKMVNQVRNVPIKMKFNKLDGDQWYISVFSDASKNTLPDGESSAMGYMIFLTTGHVTGEVKNACPLYWRSTKIPRMIGSSFEGEAIALEEGVNVAFTIMKDLAAITGVPENMIKVEGICDADDVVKAVNNTTQKSKDRTSWEIGRVRQMLNKKEICRVKWQEGAGNVADVLTKRGAAKHLIQRTMEFGMI